MKFKLLPVDWREDAPLAAPSEHSLLKADTSLTGFIAGPSPTGCYALTVNPLASGAPAQMQDFIRYESAHGRQVSVHSPGFDVMPLLTTPTARVNDPVYLIHSTTLPNYALIRADGWVKSTARLRRDGLHREAIGFAPLGEPLDYLDYVMFAPLDGGCGAEMVVNSHLRGEVCYDPDAEYEPQARMYFDAKRIIADGLAVRDGVHTIKVHDALELSKYLLQTVFGADLPLSDGKTKWTPATFTKAADAHFLAPVIAACSEK
ncbi:MAG: hypothetical protein FWD83_00765 [Promicromonosporaceae bacterium]|nr:hypothetical protein [Promicromonosporaceae bacterium]